MSSARPRLEELAGEVLSSVLSEEQQHPWSDLVRNLESNDGTANQRILTAAAALAVGNPRAKDWCAEELMRQREIGLGTTETGADYDKFVLAGLLFMASSKELELSTSALELARLHLLSRALFGTVLRDAGTVTLPPGIRCGSLYETALGMALWRSLGGATQRPTVGRNWAATQRRPRMAYVALGRLTRAGVQPLRPSDQEACVKWLARRAPPWAILDQLAEGGARFHLPMRAQIDFDGNLDAWLLELPPPTDNPRPAVTIGSGRYSQMRPAEPPMGFRGRLASMELLRRFGGPEWVGQFEGETGMPNRPGWKPCRVELSLRQSTRGSVRAWVLGPNGVKAV